MGEVTLKRLEGWEDWKPLLSGLNANPLHLKEVWLSDADEGSLDPLVWRRDGRIIGGTVAMRVKRKRLKLLSSNHSLTLPTPPAFVPGYWSKADCYGELIDYARAEGFKQLDIHPRWGEDFSEDGLFSRHAINELIEFTLDLDHEVDALLAGMHAKHRKNMRRAEKNGVSCAHAGDFESFSALMKLQKESAKRGAERGNPFSTPNEEFARRAHSAVYADGPGKLLVASHEGKVVAALAYLVFGDRAITVRSGSTGQGYKVSAMYMLHLELIKSLKELGVVSLNLGGVPCGAREPGHPQAGLYDFKRYFGGDEHIRSRVSMPL